MRASRHGEVERDEAGEVAHELAGDEDREKVMKLRGRKESGDDGRDREPKHIAARLDARSEGDRDIERVAILGDVLGDVGDDVGDSFAASSEPTTSMMRKRSRSGTREREEEHENIHEAGWSDIDFGN